MQDGTILVLAYDFSGENIRNREVMERKIGIGGFDAADRLLIICWGARRESIQLSERVRIESLRPPLGQFRPLCDFLFIFAAPRIARKLRVRPQQILIAEFPLVWAAFVVKLFCGGTINMQLNNLPSQLASTRGFVNRLYARVNELLGHTIPDRYFAINEATRRYLLSLGVKKDRIAMRLVDTITPDLPKITRAQKGIMRKTLGIPADAPFIFSAGRLEPEKGFEELIKTFSGSRCTGYLVIAGDGILREKLEALARASGVVDHVRFAGLLKREDMWNCYKDADVFVLLSLSEALGMVFWEAMYMRVPVIGRPVGGIKETIGQDGLRGSLWDSADGPEAFKRKIEQAVARGPEIEAMVERAREYVIQRTGAPA